MVKLQLSFLAIALLAVSVSAIVKETCPWVVGKYPYSEEKMTGTWHVISYANNRPNHEAKKCAKFEVGHLRTKDDSIFNVKFKALDNENKKIFQEGYSKYYKPERKSMMLGVMKKAGSEEYDEVRKQTIIATDYDTYVLYLECNPTFNATSNEFGRAYMACIGSREKTLNEDVRKTLLSVISGYDIDESAFKMVDQTDCPE